MIIHSGQSPAAGSSRSRFHQLRARAPFPGAGAGLRGVGLVGAEQVAGIAVAGEVVQDRAEVVFVEPAGRGGQTQRLVDLASAEEVLRLTGIRCEELLELSHHSITEYRLPSTGEVVPLLQIAPSKTDTERLLLVSPELADVLSAIVTRIRRPDGAIPLVAAYDVRENCGTRRCLLFQRSIGSENRAYTPTAIRKLLIRVLAATGLTTADGDPLLFSPHDFRRVFVTDAIMNGLPPHIAQIICGHKTIDTTMGYKSRLFSRGDRVAPGVHRPPPGHSPQPGVSNPDR
jgi:integrase